MSTTRYYFPSTGAAPIAPGFDASWAFTTVATRLVAVSTKIGSAPSTINMAPGNGVKGLYRQYIHGPIAAQTISGNVKGQYQISRSKGTGTPWVGVRIAKPDGTIRGTLLALTAGSTGVSSGLINCNAPLSTALSPVTSVAGDYLVIEIGAVITATSNVSTSVGDSAGVDLPEDTTTTAVDDPWIEFDSVIADASSGTVYTLTAATGAFSVTGQAAGLPVTSKVSAVAGAFSATGQAAGLPVTRKVGAAAGSVALTGHAAALPVTRKVGASAGSCALTGIAAGLPITRRITAAAGAVTVAGTASGLPVTRRVAAAAGTFTVTGLAAALRVTRRIAAGAGALTVAGVAAGLPVTRRIAAAAGAIALTGQSARLAITRRLSAGAGAFTFTGHAASLPIVRRLRALTGAFSWTGAAAALTIITGGVQPIGVVTTLIGIRALAASVGIRQLRSRVAITARAAPVRATPRPSSVSVRVLDD